MWRTATERHGAHLPPSWILALTVARVTNAVRSGIRAGEKPLLRQWSAEHQRRTDPGSPILREEDKDNTVKVDCSCRRKSGLLLCLLCLGVFLDYQGLYDAGVRHRCLRGSCPALIPDQSAWRAPGGHHDKRLQFHGATVDGVALRDDSLRA